MTRDELYDIWKNKIAKSSVLKLTHKNMKTVEFYAMAWEESVFHKFTGYWIALQNGEIIIGDTIKIRKEDLQNWSVVEE